MSIARHHAEWLSLLDVSGPFLTMPVLLRVFPQGLDAADPEINALLRAALREWEDESADPAIHTAWIRLVLEQVLGLPGDLLRAGPEIPAGLRTASPESGETIAPDLVLIERETERPCLLVAVYPPGQDLERPIPGRHPASPATRMMDLLHAAGVRLGLVTNGERWMLVDAPRGETTGFASWYASLWIEEPVTLQAFRSLLGVRRWFGVPPTETLETMLADSANAQQEVTDQLGRQVRRAVEILIQALDRSDRDHDRTLLAGAGERVLYSAALTVMMRLVFLLSAEERGLLRLGDDLYDQSYAVSTLRAQLRAEADAGGEEVLERRRDAWSRLLATFRAVHGGIEHDRLRLPAYGGDLFDPDRYPFLEGRSAGTGWRDTPAVPLPIDNRAVLHLLEALQVLQVRVPGGGPAEARLLSFRALDIEQIGHVYEGLLDHTARRAAEPLLGLTGKEQEEPIVPLAVLEAATERGRAALLATLKDGTGRTEKALARDLEREAGNSPSLRTACDNDDALVARVHPFAALLRSDSTGLPIILAAGSVYVAPGEDRRSTGTHYTPRSLTEPIVQYTLEPLVYHGPAEGEPRERWRLLPARELLALRVCDPAMGSGAFLVQACRYLAERLVEAWAEAEAAHAGRVVVTPEGDLSTGSPSERPLPVEPEERLTIARRLVADRCLYGVDVNPMAVEMAKLSLWLVTLQKDRPFTFLDHALRCGDSLVGVNVRQLLAWSLAQRPSVQGTVFRPILQRALSRAMRLRQRIERTEDLSVRDTEEKACLLRAADDALALVHLGADLLVSTGFLPKAKAESAAQTLLYRFQLLAHAALDLESGAWKEHVREQHRRECAQLRTEADRLLHGRRPFHWPLEFPEVFMDEDDLDTPIGFDAILGNPPFSGGQKITGILGTDYRDYLVQQVAGGRKGSADISAYFFLRAEALLRSNGGFGLLATNTIAQGDTREVGLEQIEERGSQIIRAVPSRKWPGEANLEVVNVWVRRGEWHGSRLLGEQQVPGITPFLTIPGRVSGKPYRLAANAGKSFIGSYVLGMGFVLEPEEAEALIARDPRNRDVLFPYLNGEDLNSRPDQSPSRWVINFHDWPLERAREYQDCWKIIEEKVRPERQRRKPNGDYALRRPLPEKYWIYAEKRPALYATIAGMERVLVVSLVSNHVSLAFSKTRRVFAHRLAVFPLSSWADFAFLQSGMHYWWAWTYSSTMRVDLNYSPSDCFETLPFPCLDSSLAGIGQTYHSYRESIMRARQEGLTKTYNRFHNQDESADDIEHLRELHVEMDRAVVNAYGWHDLYLGHGFHQTRQGIRFTMSEPAREEVLSRLLELNHERYAEEVRLGLHEVGARRRKRAKGGPMTASLLNGTAS